MSSRDIDELTKALSVLKAENAELRRRQNDEGSSGNQNVQKQMEDMQMQLSYLSNHLAQKEGECSHQALAISSLKQQRDMLQAKLSAFERNSSISQELDSALKILEENPYIEQNRTLKIQLEAAQKEAEASHLEMMRMRTEMDKHAESIRANGRASPMRDLERASNAVQSSEDSKPANKTHKVPTPFRFELPSMERFPVSRREDHVLKNVGPDQFLSNPTKSSPSLPFAPHEITLALPSDDTQNLGNEIGRKEKIAECQNRLEAATKKLKEYDESISVKPRDRIQITVHSARHLPKVDTFGSIDGFVRLEMGSLMKETKVVKNNMNPEWGETFEFEVNQEKAVKIILMDWERISSPRTIGSVLAPIRWLKDCKSQNGLFALKQSDESPVTGRDGQPAALHLEMHYKSNEGDPTRKALESDVSVLTKELALVEGVTPNHSNKVVINQGMLQPWKLKVCLHRAENLPQMDTFGTADPYVILQLEVQQFKSKTIKNSLAPEWNENFEFTVENESAELFLTVMDWDSMSAHDLIGIVRIPISDFLGKDHTGSFQILKKDSAKYVKGKQGTSQIFLSFSSAIPRLNAKVPSQDWLVAGTKLPTTISLIVDESFDAQCTILENRQSFADRFKADLAGCLNIAPVGLAVLDCTKHETFGNIIVDVNILPVHEGTPIDGKGGLSGQNAALRLARDLLEKLGVKDQCLSSGLLAKIKAGTIQNRLGQLEAENSYLLTQSGLMMQRLDEVDKVSRMRTSDAASKALKRILLRGVSKAFAMWNHETERAILQKQNEEALKHKDAELQQQQQIAGQEKQGLEQKLAQVEVMEEKAKQEAKQHAEKIQQQEAELRCMLAEAKLAQGGPFISVVIFEASHLPKVDTFGWMDPFFEIWHSYSNGDSKHMTKSLNQTTQMAEKNESSEEKIAQTEIKKKVENPKWNEKFKVPLSDGGSQASIVLKLFDFEVVSKPRPVGLLRVLVQDVIAAGTIVKEYALQKPDGSMLLGKDAAPSVVKLELKYEAGSVNPMIEKKMKEIKMENELLLKKQAEQRALQEQRESSLPHAVPYGITVTLIRGHHLPKMDTLGTIDAFCILSIGSQEFRSKTIKNSYDPVWTDEVFKFHVTSRSQSLEIQVMDWDRGAKDELCGSIRIPVGRLKPGPMPEQNYPLIGQNGLPVCGHDKQTSELVVSIVADEHPIDQVQNGTLLSDAQENDVPWKLEVRMERAEHLPKMDTFGLCDAYGVLSVCGQRTNSQVQKNTLDPVWSQDFRFTVTNSNEELVITLLDWDLAGTDELIGIVHVPLKKIRGLQNLPQESRVHTAKYPIVSKSGQPVIGADKNASMISLSLQPLDVDDDTMVDSSLEGILTVTVKSANGLPRMNLLSNTADPFLIFKVNDKIIHKTSVKHNTLEPKWDEKFEFNIEKGTTTLIGEMGHRNANGNDSRLGFFNVPLKAEYRRTSRAFSLMGNLDGGTEASGEVHLLLEFSPKSNHTDSEIPEGDHGSDAPKFILRVNVESVRNLPKVDSLGSCDPYVKLEIGNQSFETFKVKNVYEAEYHQYFDFENVSLSSSLWATVYDWNRCSSDAEIGRVEIPLLHFKMSGKEQPFELITSEKSKVYGKNEMPTILNMILSLTEVQSGTSSGNEAFTINCEIKSCSHMPKMDLFMGKCDPFFSIVLDEDNKAETKVLFNSYEGEFNQTFEFKCDKYIGKQLLFVCYDHDSGAPNQYIGEARVDLRLSDGNCDFTTHFLHDKKNNPVKGHDGEPSSFEAKIYVIESISHPSKHSNKSVLNTVDHHPQNGSKRSNSHLPETKDAGEQERLSQDLKQFEAKEKAFLEWNSLRSDELFNLNKKLSTLPSEPASSSVADRMERLKTRMDYLMSQGFTETQSNFMIGILVTLLQMLLLKILLLGN